jgi:hypothetical protein
VSASFLEDDSTAFGRAPAAHQSAGRMNRKRSDWMTSGLEVKGDAEADLTGFEF